MSALETLGWCCWYEDGTNHKGVTFSDWFDLATLRPDKCLFKMIYYSDATKQVQTMDWWYEVESKNGIIRATCTDAKKPDIEKLHPDAVFIEGFWTADDWFREVSDEAMASVW